MNQIQKLTLYIVVMMLLFGAVGLAFEPKGVQAASVQPQLLTLAMETPDMLVSVIAQKADKTDAAEKLVASLGGQITKDLHIINAFAAELTAQAAVKLSQSDAVRWVSLDAPVRRSATFNDTVADFFNQRSYANNDGTQPWAGNWVEIGDDNKPDKGKVKIDKNQLRMESQNRGIQRSLDLTNATAAVLSFEVRRESMVGVLEYVSLGVSTDGGATWQELTRFAGPANDPALTPVSFDLAAFLPAEVTLRFMTSPNNGGKLWVDNLVVDYLWDDGVEEPPPPEPVVPDFYALDGFNTNGFDGSDGNIPWSSVWVEADPWSATQNPSDGYVQVLNGELRLNNQNFDDTEPYAARNLDLSGDITNVVLSFDYRTSYWVSAGDIIAVDVSPDGGATFYIMDLIMNLSGITSGRKSYDITRFATANTVIRLRVGNNYALDNHYFYIDNVQVAYNIDPDPPLATDTKTVADDFQAYPFTFNNNAGTQNWTGPWMEVGEEDGPYEGDISIAYLEGSSRLELWTDRVSGQVWEPVRGVWRVADLSGANWAELSFIYSRMTMEDADYVAVEASRDGGNSWQEIGRIEGESLLGIDPGWHLAVFDISNYISSNTAVRLISNFANNDYYDEIFFDNIQIVFDEPVALVQPNTYLETLGVNQVWNLGINGSGVTVAVIDSGVSFDDDFEDLASNQETSRLLVQLGFNQSSEIPSDAYGHGTHVAGIIAGNGAKSEGYYKGIAPGANLIGLRVSDDYGMAYESDVVAAMQWVYDNKSSYNIRVVNLSINATVESSYHNSPMSAAAEILWFNNVVVVASAGNYWSEYDINPVLAAPAHDPFLITVGATDEKGTTRITDDVIANFSGFGTTLDGHFKPDIYAPGKNIISVLADSSWWHNDYLDRFVEGGYFRLSGTSMSAPMVSGAAALLLQAEPGLTPDQVKYRLINTARWIGPGKYLDVYAAITTSTTESANTGQIASQLLWTGYDPVAWGSVAWNSVAWNSVAWNSVAWNSVAWNSVAWNSVAWNE